jgi:hypothetical protein
MNLSEYKNTTYREFQKVLHKYSADCNKTEVRIASDIGVKSVLSVRNCFDGRGQIVSDSVLTKLMECLGMDGFVLWVNGCRKYYVKNK